MILVIHDHLGMLVLLGDCEGTVLHDSHEVDVPTANFQLYGGATTLADFDHVVKAVDQGGSQPIYQNHRPIVVGVDSCQVKQVTLIVELKIKWLIDCIVIEWKLFVIDHTPLIQIHHPILLNELGRHDNQKFLVDCNLELGCAGGSCQQLRQQQNVIGVINIQHQYGIKALDEYHLWMSASCPDSSRCEILNTQLLYNLYSDGKAQWAYHPVALV